jgi:hypothetical protein
MKSASEVVHHILQMKNEEQNLVISFLWVWWDTRKKINVGKHARSVIEVTHRVMEVAYSVDLLSVQKKDKLVETRLWAPPPPSVLKINTDGAFSVGDKSGAWGFVVLDCEGQGVLAGSG